MTRSEIFAELLKLGPEERLQIIDDLWQTIADQTLQLTDKEAEELQRRMNELENDPSIGIAWDDVRADLRKRFG